MAAPSAPGGMAGGGRGGGGGPRATASEGRRPPRLPPLKTGTVQPALASAPGHLPSDLASHIAANEKGDSKQGRIETFLASKQPHEVFALFDEDGSGAIALDEFEAALKMLGVFVPEAAVLSLFRRLDLDGDGYLSQDEFVQAFHMIAGGGAAGGAGLGGFNPSGLLHPGDAFAMFDAKRR